jgi:hypothetical protein
MSCNMLSYVEHYQPNYFLLENVAGFLEHNIHSSPTTNSGEVIHCSIKFGMVKFVTRTLIALGSDLFYLFFHHILGSLTILLSFLQVSSPISAVTRRPVRCPPKPQPGCYLGCQTRSFITRLPYPHVCISSWANESYAAHGRETGADYKEQKSN